VEVEAGGKLGLQHVQAAISTISTALTIARVVLFMTDFLCQGEGGESKRLVWVHCAVSKYNLHIMYSFNSTSLIYIIYATCAWWEFLSGISQIDYK
jgi:hypothetical protein